MTHHRKGPAEVVVVGSLNVDLIVHAPRLPHAGETLTGTRFFTDQGGKGANQAVAAARIGARVAMVGRLGRDLHGERLRAALHDDQIDASAIGTDDAHPTGVASIVVAEGGENCIVVVPGANHALLPAHADAAAALIGAAKIVVLQLEVPMTVVTRTLQIARQAQVVTLLNAAPAAALTPDQYVLIDWLVVNEGEAAELLGRAVESDAEALAAALALHERGPQHVVLTRGAAGLVHASHEGALQHAAARVDPVDTTGAGDTFVGALAASLAAGLPPAAALRWGQAAAALATTRAGTQAAMPLREEVLALLESGAPGVTP